VPVTVERMLRGYLARRAGPDETFLAFARRHDVEALKSMFVAEAA
jgi:ferredoxin-nitrite reductase